MHSLMCALNEPETQREQYETTEGNPGLKLLKNTSVVSFDLSQILNHLQY